jgi:hypothetical protein
MRYWLLIFASCILFIGVRSQYFYESLDLYYNLRPSLVEDQKAKIGFSTYSNVNFENTIPNILDNFKLVSRFRFTNSSHWFVKNTEFGAGISSFITGANQFSEQYPRSPLNIKIYNDVKYNYVITPGLQYIRTWKSDNKADSRLILGLGMRYNIVGGPEMFSNSYPFGYDLSLQLMRRFFSFQFMHSTNSVYNSFTFRTADVSAFTDSDKKRISIPVEFQNLTFFTIALGDPYYKLPTENNKLTYNLYFTMRRLFPSNKEYRPELSFKNLDYIFGFNLKYKQFDLNPEYASNRTDLEYHDLKAKSYSILVGYSFGDISIKLGYSHVVYYELAKDLQSLQNNDHVKLDKLIFAIDYSFK